MRMSQKPKKAAGIGINLIPQKSSDERRREMKDKILKAAGSLFTEKGYSKTTMRQISLRAGILTGSLYNVFPGKEDILKTMIDMSYDDALKQYEKHFDAKGDLLAALAFPLALEFYSVSRNRRAAEILHEAHSSWKVVNSIADRTMEWVSGRMEAYGLKQDPNETKDRFLALMGAVGNLISKMHFTCEGDYGENLKKSLEVFCALFKLPAYDLDSTVERMDSILSENDVVIGEYRI